MLYLVATPIGNLGDITFRAIETLKSCDYILCEDTRHSLQLLNHYHITKPLKSYHKFNEASREKAILDDLREGKTIALISDAGTPGISDPGERLAQSCIAAGIPLAAIPGPCAAIMALTCSGMDASRFQFCGFLPKTSGKLREALTEILAYNGTTICYESPQRLLETLALIQELSPNRKLALARELTKKFEEIKQGTPIELIKHFESHTLKGEIVLLISAPAEIEDWSHLPIEEHIKIIQDQLSVTEKEAIKIAAKARNTPKRVIYNALIQKKQK